MYTKVDSCKEVGNVQKEVGIDTFHNVYSLYTVLYREVISAHKKKEV